jgi:hypothetical protein
MTEITITSSATSLRANRDFKVLINGEHRANFRKAAGASAGWL